MFMSLRKCSSDAVAPSLFPVYLIRFNLKSCLIHSCHIHSAPSYRVPEKPR